MFLLMERRYKCRHLVIDTASSPVIHDDGLIEPHPLIYTKFVPCNLPGTHFYWDGEVVTCRCAEHRISPIDLEWDPIDESLYTVHSILTD
jgi:hypothetical protein